MEQIRNFIDLVGQGDNVGAKDALSELLASRAFESLESKKRGIAGTLFNTEEVEQIDELSITPAARKQSKERENQYHDDEEFPIRRNQDLSGKSLVDLKVAHRHHSETGGGANIDEPEERARGHYAAKSMRRIEKHVGEVYGKRAANNLNQRKYNLKNNEEVEVRDAHGISEDFTNKKYSLNEDPSDGGGSDIRHHYNPKGEQPKLGKSGTHVLDTGKGKYKVLQAPASNRLNYGKPVKRGAEITNAHLSDHYEYGRGVVHVHTHNPKEAMMSRADADRHFE